MNPPPELSAGTPPHSAVAPIRGLDAVALMFSGLCLVHCLALPVLIAILPLAASSFVAGERFHQWLLLGVVPTSVLALGWGWRRHRSRLVFWLGVIALTLMTYAAFGRQINDLSEAGDRWLTVVGASMLALGHLRNYQLRHRGHAHRHAHDAP